MVKFISVVNELPKMIFLYLCAEVVGNLESTAMVPRDLTNQNAASRQNFVADGPIKIFEIVIGH
jgi:hypothetical protein